MLANLRTWIVFRLFRRRLRRERGTVLGRGTVFGLRGLHIGRYCYIGPGAYWNAIGKITIKDGVIIGPRSMMWTENHDYRHGETMPYGGPNVLKPITVEEGVWIGADVKVCPGVTIGRGSVIALGSVVTRDVAPFTLVGGNPACPIRSRENVEEATRLVEQKAWYMKRKLGEMIE